MNCCISSGALSLLLFTISSVSADRIVWFDGSLDQNGPPGKLLTDNEGYWGECVLTGVDYTYETQPDAPADIYKDETDKFGRRLLDGYYSGNYWGPVGLTGKPIVVVFDFKRKCVFTEIDLISRSKQINASVGVSDEGQEWMAVGGIRTSDCAESMLQRIKLPSRPSGRYVKLTVDAETVTYLDEVLAWGDADSSDSTPEYLKPVAAPPVVNMVALESIPGKAATACTDSRFFAWRTGLGKLAESAAVWSGLDTWGELTPSSILPEQASIGKPIEIVMARNEGECAAVALTNTSISEPATLRVSLSPFEPVDAKGSARGITGELRVGGTISSRWYGVNVGPLFSQDNMLGRSLMRKFLTNGAAIVDFPTVTLSPAGSLVFWIKVQTNMAEPGVYQAALSYNEGEPVTVRVRVADVKLPDTRVWLQSWSGTTTMFPFQYADRLEREVDYKTSLGINVWDGFPEKGSASELAGRKCRAIFHIWGIGDYGHKIYNALIKADQITPEIEKEVTGIIQGHVSKARELGLSYDDWYVELTDEPGVANAEVFGAFCRIIRKADAKVRIYCNPGFWVGFENGGVSPDGDVFRALSGWYNECVDISCPLFLHLDNRPESARLFGHERSVNSFYSVCSQSAKSEKREMVEEYRRFAWKAANLGWNGWGFYSYYAPRGNAWNDFDANFLWTEDLPDYQVVYPGPRGPIPSRQAESVREGWEDYRLLALLKERKPEVFSSTMKDYAQGRPVEELRLAALQALAER